MRLPFTIASRAIQGNFDFLVSLLGGNRIVRGIVSSAGGVTAGSGFTPSRTGTGAYTVTFGQGFASLPSVVCAPVTGGGGAYIITALSATAFSVSFFNTVTGAAADTAFHFHAIGP